MEFNFIIIIMILVVSPLILFCDFLIFKGGGIPIECKVRKTNVIFFKKEE